MNSKLARRAVKNGFTARRTEVYEIMLIGIAAVSVTMLRTLPVSEAYRDRLN